MSCGPFVTVPFSAAVRDCTGGNPKVQRKDYLSEGDLPVIDQGQEFIAGFTDAKNVYCGKLPVVVFGDSDFASNQLVDQLTNKDLLLNTIAWMVGEEDQLAVRSKGGESQTLTLTIGQSLVVWLLSVLVAPGAAMLGALLTWRMRRAL